jgi:hypothetical protein
MATGVPAARSNSLRTLAAGGQPAAEHGIEPTASRRLLSAVGGIELDPRRNTEQADPH